MFRNTNSKRSNDESAAAAPASTPSSGQSRNLAARMGRWSAAHWKTATFGWLALVLVAFAVGGMVGVKNIDPNTQGPGESGRMDRILDAGFKQPAGESVLVQSDTLRTSDPAFRAAVADVIGAPVGAVVNYRLLDKLGETAIGAYRMRWFARA